MYKRALCSSRRSGSLASLGVGFPKGRTTFERSEGAYAPLGLSGDAEYASTGRPAFLARSRAGNSDARCCSSSSRNAGRPGSEHARQLVREVWRAKPFIPSSALDLGSEAKRLQRPRGKWRESKRGSGVDAPVIRPLEAALLARTWRRCRTWTRTHSPPRRPDDPYPATGRGTWHLQLAPAHTCHFRPNKKVLRRRC